MMSLEFSDILAVLPPPGDFGAKINGSVLILPGSLRQFAERNRLQNVEELVSFLHAFPSAFAAELQWNPDEVLQAREALFKLLRGSVREEILNPTPPTRRSFGAF